MMEDDLEAKKEPRGIKGGVWTEDSGIPVPQEPESGPVKTPRKTKKMAAGGSASARADGIAQRGKTRGTIIACGGGWMKK